MSYARDLKLGAHIKRLIPDKLRIPRIYELWKGWKMGMRHPQIRTGDMEYGVHGVTRIRGGRVCDIEISNADPLPRQLISVVHELIHNFAHPERPEHRDIHTLAAGLAKNVFPRFEQREATLLTPDELEVLDYDMYDDDFDDFDDDVDDLLEDLDDDSYDFEFEDEDDDDFDYEFEDGDDDDYDLFRSKWRRKLKRFRRSTAGKILAPHKFLPKKVQQVLMPHLAIKAAMQRKRRKKRRKKAARAAAAARVTMAGRTPVQVKKSAGLPAVATAMTWGGWMVPYITKMFEGQTFLLPRRGVIRATPQHNIGGYKAPTWPAFWSQLIQSLQSGDNRTVKGFDKQTAVGGVATVCNLVNSRSVGLIVRLSDSITNGTNENVRVRHFTQAGATELQYIIDVELEKGTAEYIVLHVENDRGAGVPTSRNDHQLTIDADQIRAGARVAIESINLRELEA